MPRGENVWNQVLDVKPWRRSGSLPQLKTQLWRMLMICRVGVDKGMREDDSETVRRWIHCFNQLSNTYAKITMDSDMEARLKALEALATTHAAQNGHQLLGSRL